MHTHVNARAIAKKKIQMKWSYETNGQAQGEGEKWNTLMKGKVVCSVRFGKNTKKSRGMRELLHVDVNGANLHSSGNVYSSACSGQCNCAARLIGADNQLSCERQRHIYLLCTCTGALLLYPHRRSAFATLRWIAAKEQARTNVTCARRN